MAKKSKKKVKKEKVNYTQIAIVIATTIVLVTLINAYFKGATSFSIETTDKLVSFQTEFKK